MAGAAPGFSIGGGPKVDFAKLGDFFRDEAPERLIPGGPKFSELMWWLNWAAPFTGHPGLRDAQGRLMDLKAGHGGWDRQKDIELVQAHADVTIQKQEAERGGKPE